MIIIPNHYVECPLRNGCLNFKHDLCNECDFCGAPVGFIKGGEDGCEHCGECVQDES